MLRKYLDQKKFKGNYDDIFGKKPQFKFTEIPALTSRKVKRKYGQVRLDNLKAY